jgi:hypothetical protein
MYRRLVDARTAHRKSKSIPAEIFADAVRMGWIARKIRLDHLEYYVPRRHARIDNGFEC